MPMHFEAMATVSLPSVATQPQLSQCVCACPGGGPAAAVAAPSTHSVSRSSRETEPCATLNAAIGGVVVSLLAVCTRLQRRGRGQAGRGQRIARRARAYRMPLPPDIDEIKPPRWNVLMDAVKVKDAKDAVIPTWKLKPKLGIYSPTPQYAPMHHITPKPYWQKSNFIKRKMKKFYRKMMLKRMEQENFKLRYLPDPTDRMAMAAHTVSNAPSCFKAEEDLWSSMRKKSVEELLDAMDDKNTRLGLASKRIMPNWRPGFQTLAIRDLRDHYLRRVDIVCEVRDARAPWVTAHPDIPGWVRPKPRVIVLTRADLVPPQCLEETLQYIRESEQDRGIPVVAVDARRSDGLGIEELRLELMKAGAFVNRRRKRKGINPRAVRTLMLGFPNLGKSAIINALTGRKVAKKKGTAGETRKLTWHAIGGFRNTELHFLDSPGVIPVCFGKRYTQEQASILCMCRVFGEKIIDRTQTMYDLLNHLGKLQREHPNMIEKTVWRETKRIYKVDLMAGIRREGPIIPDFVSARNPDPFFGKMLSDFNHGFWGKVMLEIPPAVEERRQDYRHAFQDDGGRQQQQLTQGVRGALTAPKEDVLLPTKKRELEVVPAVSASSDGLFDGW